MPFGSTIMMTEPSPKMVLPENIGMCRSFELIGFTTISSVWNTASTTMPKGARAHMGHDDEALVAGRGGIDAEQVLEADERQELLAQSQDRRVLDPLDAMLGFGRGADEFDHGDLRDREALAAGFDDQRRDDGKRQRDLDGEGRALVRHGRQIDGAADLVDVGLDHIHADAAAGHAGDLAAVEKPGAKMNLPICASVRRSASDSLTRPLSIAFFLMRWMSRPLPSSAISMMMWPP